MNTLNNNRFPVLISLAFISLFLSSCLGCMDGVSGNGNVISESRSIDDFISIDVGGAFEVELIQGDAVALLLEADENLMDIITTEVHNGRLEVKTMRPVYRSRQLKATITVKELKDLDLSGAVELWSKGQLSVDHLTLDGSGATEIEMGLDAKKITIGISGAGELDLWGKAEAMDVEISGAADIDAVDLEVVDCRIRISGAGEANVNVSGVLDAELSGAATLRYAGDPSSISQRTSGASSIKRY